ncbi:hypothetical protein LTR53_006086 [Teratosphaeriaceae sp. CCFEE 6253]|nr:hypothetical protein LTR53_006086 [Teratosphaeriaceae sp. CCFEE 6253]
MANDETTALSMAALHDVGNVQTRRVLGDVSPNLKRAPIVTSANKLMAGSPLKRSFTTMLGDGPGFTYLKSRQLSVDKPLSQVDHESRTTSSRRLVFGSKDAGYGESGRQTSPLALTQSVATTAATVPHICEPSPTEANTPSDSGEGEDSSTERKSFSSLINYNPSSQTSHLLVNPTPRAELLKLRLRVAMYKVRTDQVNVPFSRLRVDAKGLDWDNPGDSQKQATGEAVEEAVAQLRREAQERVSKVDVRPVPKLLPAPVLLPTEFSSRIIYGSILPSSPPESPFLDQSKHAERTAAPGRPLSSPRHGAGQHSTRDEADLTSSVVKGRVAEGLLGLRTAG